MEQRVSRRPHRSVVGLGDTRAQSEDGVQPVQHCRRAQWRELCEEGRPVAVGTVAGHCLCEGGASADGYLRWHAWACVGTNGKAGHRCPREHAVTAGTRCYVMSRLGRDVMSCHGWDAMLCHVTAGTRCSVMRCHVMSRPRPPSACEGMSGKVTRGDGEAIMSCSCSCMFSCSCSSHVMPCHVMSCAYPCFRSEQNRRATSRLGKRSCGPQLLERRHIDGRDTRVVSHVEELEEGQAT
jgi:hypothetical protein